MLADRLNMEPHRIAKWFDNRRSRQRTMPKSSFPINNGSEMDSQKGKRGRRRRSVNPPETDLRAVVAQTMDEIQREAATQTISSIVSLIPTTVIPDESSVDTNDIPRPNVTKVFKVLEANAQYDPK